MRFTVVRRLTALPGRLPDGEAIAWQGRPDWRVLTRRVYKLRWIAGYFACLLLWDVCEQAASGDSVGRIVGLDAPLVLIATATILLVTLFGWLSARTTLYTITSKHTVIQFGVALPAVLAIPHRRVGAAAVAIGRDHTGDVALRLKPGERVPLHKIWPHARPWRFLAAEPMLLAVPQAAVVGALLSRALASADAAEPVVAKARAA